MHGTIEAIVWHSRSTGSARQGEDRYDLNLTIPRPRVDFNPRITVIGVVAAPMPSTA
jgi:hypothetical protein